MSKCWVLLSRSAAIFLQGYTATEAARERAEWATTTQSITKLRPATPDEVAEGGVASICWNHPGFGNKFKYNDCKCGECK